MASVHSNGMVTKTPIIIVSGIHNYVLVAKHLCLLLEVELNEGKHCSLLI